jgi:hypothetical protein
VVPVKKGLAKGEAVPEGVPLELRVGHLLRISGYLDIAILSMWAQRQAEISLGMAEASVRGAGPGGPEGPDEELLARLRDLVGEAQEYHAVDDFPAAMARMRVADDLVALHLIRLAGQ